MSKPTWRNSLAATLAQVRLNLPQPDAQPRVALVGIGHELCGDDAAGVLIARALQAKLREMGNHIGTGNHAGLPLQVIDGGAAPENCTGALRRLHPDLVILLDAAQLDAAPGTVCWLDCNQLAGFSASTHTLPLDILAHYLLAELGCQVALLGIQPADNSFDAPLSSPVQEAMRELVETLSSSDLFAHG